MNKKPKKEISKKQWNEIYDAGYKNGTDETLLKVRDFIDKKLGL